MKRYILCLILVSFVSLTACGPKPEDMASRIHWTGQSSVFLETGGKRVYIDPLRITDQGKADIILITHSHYDHLSLDDIAKIIKPGTRVLAPADCAKQIGEKFDVKITVVEPGFKQVQGGIGIEAVLAYNITKTRFHPRENKWVGYVLSVEGTRIYHCGDTERIPEMKNIKADIILVPLGQTYTMNSVDDAVDSVLDVRAKIAIPFHYGMYEGTAEDADAFTRALEGKVTVVRKNME